MFVEFKQANPDGAISVRPEAVAYVASGSDGERAFIGLVTSDGGGGCIELRIAEPYAQVVDKLNAAEAPR